MEFDTDRFRSALRQQIGEERLELWFEDVHFRLRDGVMLVSADSAFRVDRLRRDFKDDISASAIAAGLTIASVDFCVDEDVALEDPITDGAKSNSMSISSSFAASSSASRSNSSTLSASSEKSSESTADTVAADGNSTTANSAAAMPRMLRATSAISRGRKFRTFDTFQHGNCNKLARTSVEMVSRQPGELSPLLIHGPTGVGKTHLVEAVWCGLKTTHRRARVLYLSAEQFTSYFLEALKSSGLPAFRNKYRQADLLIIDDIQFFAGKQATLVELAYTIDELTRQNRQLILTADRPLPQLGLLLGQDLANRLGGGLVCGMSSVDQATMEAISRKWAQDRNIHIDDPVHTLIASKMHGDARQLSGILNRLNATSLAMGQPITHRMANEVIHELVPSQARVIRLKDIRKAICEVFGLESDTLKQSSRSRAITQPRMLAMWLARKHTAAGLHEISQFFGRRSHSSAVTAHNTVDGWIRKGEMLVLSGQQCDVRDVIGQIETNLAVG